MNVRVPKWCTNRSRTRPVVADLPGLRAEDVGVEQAQVGERIEVRADAIDHLALDQQAEAAEPIRSHPLVLVLPREFLRIALDGTHVHQRLHGRQRFAVALRGPMRYGTASNLLYFIGIIAHRADHAEHLGGVRQAHKRVHPARRHDGVIVEQAQKIPLA